MLLKMGLKSLRTKLILLTFVPTAIILTAVAIIGIYAYGQVIGAQIISNGREDVQITATRLEAQMEEYKNVLSPLAHVTDMSSDDLNTRQIILDQNKDQLSVFDGGVVVLNTRGKVVAVRPYLEKIMGQDWSDTDFFREIALSPRTLLSQMNIKEAEQKKVAIVAVPILREHNEFAGILLGAFNLGKTSTSSFYGSIVKLHVSQDKNVYLVDPYGDVLYHTNEDEIGLNYSNHNPVRMVISGETNALHTNDETGQSMLISYAPVPNSTWGLVIEQNWAKLLEPGLLYWLTLLGLLLLGLLLPAVLVSFAVRKVTEPIQVLSEATRQVSSGNLEQIIHIHSGDELEDLSHQFNQMSHNLSQTVNTLQKTNRSLQALRQCNQALVHATDENMLLNQICQIFVDIGGYRLAWIGFIQKNGGKNITPVAKAGPDIGFLDSIKVTWSDDEYGNGTVGPSIRERHPVIISDILSDPRFNPWLARASLYGYRSVISLPLFYQEEIYGAIVIYATNPDAFDQTEINLLEQLSKDLAYGIAVLRIQVERGHKDAELARYRNHLEEMVKARTLELEHLYKDLVEAKEAAETADQLKSAFLATMSHELRTPLNSIIGFTGILLQRIVGPLNSEQNKQLQFVQTSANHLLELINDILDISKIEAGQLIIAAEKFNLTQSIENVVQLVMPMANKKNLPMHMKIDPLVIEVVGDQRRIEQVIINLLNNAVKFTENGYIELICQADGHQVTISVCDTGIGIKPEQIEKIFKPFSQVDTGLSRKYEGTGLGLSISKKLVEKMGGTLTFESQWDLTIPPFRPQGVGSTFTILLPQNIRE